MRSRAHRLDRDGSAEFTPPPGFPSLAELNITTEMLRTRTPKALALLDRSASLAPRLNAECGNGRLYTANVDDVIVCFDWLEALGHYEVVVTQDDYSDGSNGRKRLGDYGTAFVWADTMT
jgi:hypothetical protein